MDNQPVIELLSYRISNIRLQHFNELNEVNNLDPKIGDISANIGVSEDKEIAQIELSTSVAARSKNNDIQRAISMTVVGQFKINEKINHIDYLRVNGTAILFPYLRTFISVVSSLDNEDAIVIPTVNTNNFTSESE
ncbi:protein-export chaperone SecB [Aerococcus sanguinicola]|nr:MULTISPECIES: protein-export chaperone SecB [Aerococcus]MDK7049411.1 protein-export chaperone SecB [Aerococcus sanguinicola]